MRDIKDYLRYYIGCEIMGINCDDEPCKGYLTGIHGEYEAEIQFFEEGEFHVSEEPYYNRFTEVKPILRRLSSMTREELIEGLGKPADIEILKIHDLKKHIEWDYRFKHPNPECNNADGYSYSGDGMDKVDPFLKPPQFHYLLSKGFDLFGLIDEGLAIESPPSTINK